MPPNLLKIRAISNSKSGVARLAQFNPESHSLFEEWYNSGTFSFRPSESLFHDQISP